MEQRRIVARIDELFTEIADGETALAQARDDLDTWRRALLKAAVTGELTREWRAVNSPNEAGAGLLERIRRERLAQPTKGRRQAQQGTDHFDLSDLPEIPEGWTWASLSELGEFGRGKSKHRPRDDSRLYGGRMPFIQTGSVSNCQDYIQEYTQTYSELGVQQSKVWPSGTLCITIAANIAKTGILTFEACFPDSIVGLVPASGINAYYIHLWMQNIQSRLEAFAPATAQKNINLEVLNGVAVPLPSSREQDAIAFTYQSAIEEMKDALIFVENSPQRSSFRQAILKAAFEGRLVEQDSREESADRLLARLSEQNDLAIQPRGTQRSRKASLAAE